MPGQLTRLGRLDRAYTQLVRTDGLRFSSIADLAGARDRVSQPGLLPTP